MNQKSAHTTGQVPNPQESPAPTQGGLQIKDVSERTGIAAATIRMWEQRYSFPEPSRTPAGYRIYSEEDVDVLRKVLALRHRGLSVPKAIESARDTGSDDDRPSIYAAVASTDHGARPQTLRKSTLIALSRAIEHEALAQGARPLLFGAFQHEEFYRQVETRYRRIARVADAAAVFADFPRFHAEPDAPAEVPIDPKDSLGNEWAVVVDAPGYAACLLAWEIPGTQQVGGPDDLDRRFEALWTLDPFATRRAAEVAARLAGRQDAELGERLTTMLVGRPLATEQPSPALTAVTNRLVAYLEAR